MNFGRTTLQRCEALPSPVRTWQHIQRCVYGWRDSGVNLRVASQPQRPPSQHDSVTVWHLGHSMCARTKIGASVVPQYGQRGGSALAGFSSVALSDCMTNQ